MDICGRDKTLENPQDLTFIYGGAKYFMIITDNTIQMRWIFLLHDRKEVWLKLKSWILHIKNLTSRVPVNIRSDRKDRFGSKATKAFYEEEDII